MTSLIDVVKFSDDVTSGNDVNTDYDVILESDVRANRKIITEYVFI
jgi:hypothetical protein